MKRFLVCFLAFLTIGIASFAEPQTDLNALSTDELFDLLLKIDKLLTERTGKPEALIYPGEYVVGADMEPGVYLFTGVEDYEGNAFGVGVYADRAAKAHFDRKSFDRPGISQSVQLTLTAGMIVTVSGGVGHAQLLESPDWMPETTVERSSENEEWTDIIPGTYVCGLDIAAGSYIVRCPADESENTWVTVRIFLDHDHYSEYDIYKDATLQLGDEVYITLQENMVLNVSRSTGMIQKVEKPSFAP